MYDYILVGCGLHNATFARLALEAGKKVLIIDKRSHIGGNCYDEVREGINVHVYGPHQFHTRRRDIWEFVNRFAEFNHYRAHIKAHYDGRTYSMPPNMMLYQQLWGCNTPQQAKLAIEESRIPCEHPTNLKEMVEDAVGREVYEKFYYGYSLKQWGVDPSQIPVGVGKRLPIRFNWIDRWFEDEYEGIPKNGYTAMIANMIDGADVELNVDYLCNWMDFYNMGDKIVYTGPIDQYFNYQFGPLEYRTLQFDHQTVQGDFQGNAIINYTQAEVPFTRITEHKHFAFLKSDHSIITREYSRTCKDGDVPYYPIGDTKNVEHYQKYKNLAANTNVIFSGRLGSFKYMDMDTTIGQALSIAKKEIYPISS